MRGWTPLVVAALVTAAGAGVPAARQQAATPEAFADRLVDGLRPAPGREAVLQNCVLCHSTALIVSSHMSRARWDATLTWMQEQQKLWPLEPAERDLILDYLEATQGVAPADATRSVERPSPWARPLYRPNPIW